MTLGSPRVRLGSHIQVTLSALRYVGEFPKQILTHPGTMNGCYVVLLGYVNRT